MTTEPTKKLTGNEVKAARKKLWHMGSLEWKLNTTQKDIYNFIHGKTDKITVVNASRRTGKSVALTIMAIEQCLKTPNSIVKFLQPEQKMVRMNIKPLMALLLSDCPEELRPSFKTMDNIYVFPNGSEIQLAGTDNGNYDKLRGGNCHLALIDEAGFCSDLQHIITAILIPTTLLTGGKIVLSSTTPKNPNHDFIKEMQRAGIENRLIVKSIYDALDDQKNEAKPLITPEIIEEIIRSYPGGETSDEFRSEFLCELLLDSDSSVIPEFKKVKSDVVVEWPRPVFFHSYTSMDIGFTDLTVALFAFYDFENGVIVVDDELVMNGPQMTTDILAEGIRKKENALWTNKLTGEFEKPYLRVSDNNMIVINDLQRLHGLFFMPTKKDNKDAQINQLRMKMQARQIVINPRCKTLIQHCEMGTWNKARTEYLRSADNGHFDAIDALVYLVRNIDFNKNPFPKHYKLKLQGANADNWFFKEDFAGPKKEHENPVFNRLSDKFKAKTTFKRDSHDNPGLNLLKNRKDLKK